jgi:hypothetical protein
MASRSDPYFLGVTGSAPVRTGIGNLPPSLARTQPTVKRERHCPAIQLYTAARCRFARMSCTVSSEVWLLESSQ